MKHLHILFFISMIYGATKKEQLIIDFLEARYSGNSILVKSMLADDFIYQHTPYSGLNITTSYSNGSLTVTGFISDDSVSNKLQIGDIIHEINGKTIPQVQLPIRGPVGEANQLIITRVGDSTFTTDTLELQLIQYNQNTESFINDIIAYNQEWYNFHLEIINILSRKNQIMIHYHWEGSKTEEGPVFHFYAMELIQREKNTGLIKRIEGLWSEKQFRDQFR
tara:strand:+ start:89 stop:754 length:666 start_codon:yes stop_codon:yes gene_type:complete